MTTSVNTGRGIVRIPSWVTMRFPGDLVEVLQEICAVFLEETDGKWSARKEALAVAEAIIKAQWRQNPANENKGDPPDAKVTEDAKRLLSRIIASYQEYVVQPLDSAEIGILWIP